MSFSRFLATLRARIGLALGLFLVTVGAAAVAWIAWPRQYEAVATVLVDPAPANPLVAPGWNGPRPGFVSTQIDILQSPRVALDVVRRLDLMRQPHWREAWQREQQSLSRLRWDGEVALWGAPGEPAGSIRARPTPGGGDTADPAQASEMAQWVAQSLRASLQVRPTRDSEVLTMAVRHADPGEAARIVNAFAQAYLDLQRSLRVDPAREFSTVFDGQAQEARSRLEQSQARLTAYQRERGVVIGDDRLDIESARLNDLAARLTGMQAQLAEAGTREVHSQGEAADRAPDVQSSPVLTSLRGDVVRSEARLAELGGRLGDQHPQVQEAQAQVTALRSRLEAETRRAAASVGVTHSIRRQQESQLRGALDSQRALVLRLKAARDEGGVLLREEEAAQRAYDAALARLQQARLESRTPPVGARLLTAAVPPRAPVSPQPQMHAGLSIGLGIVLAIVAVLALERIDPRLRTPGSAAELLDLQVLGVLPGPKGRGLFQPRRTPVVQPWRRPRLAAPPLQVALDASAKE